MKYQKPSLIVAPALDAVRGVGLKHDDNVDSPQPSFTTPAAYEVDE